MKLRAVGNRLLNQATSHLPVAALFVAPAAWADAAANGGRVFISTYDIALMLFSGVGLMIFVARHRRKDGRDDE